MLHSQTGNHAAYPSEQLHILTSALDALQRGWSVIPLIGGDNVRYGKRPTIPWQAYQQTIPDKATVRDWFAAGDRSACGVICGKGLIVVDFDDADRQVRFMEKFPELLDTRIVQSGGRGLYHLYFSVDFPVQSQKFAGVDLQSDGRYVVGAGSRIAGREWALVNDAPVRSLKRTELNRIVDFLSPKDQSRLSGSALVTASPTDISGDYFTHLYRAKVRELGGRNDALFHTGCQMRDAGFLRTETLATLVDVHAKQPPVDSHPTETP